MTNIAIAGSRALERGSVPRLLIRFLAALPVDTHILLRRGVFTPPNSFEHEVAELAKLIGFTIDWHYPEPFDEVLPAEDGGDVVLPTLGREATFRRDLDMVAAADLVLCFFTRDQIGDETSGTVAMVDKAVAADTPVYAYAIDGMSVLRVGEHDPKNIWARRVPRA